MLTRLSSDTHEEIYRVSAPEVRLTGFIAIHSTALGPAAGGLRMRQYESEKAAIADVLNLSAGMSHKNAAAGLPLGGGKAVIMGCAATEKNPKLLRAMGRAIETLEGRYWTAEDMGMSPVDMAEISFETRYVAGLDHGQHASGDPSPITALGVFNAIVAGTERVFGRSDLTGLKVAVQGLGHVGWHLSRMLHAAGARLSIADTNPVRRDEAVRAFGATLVAPDEIHRIDTDVFAPCAIGGVLNSKTIPELKARLVAGAANNQLATTEDAMRLHERAILYAPDFVANGGGIVNVAAEILGINERETWVAERIAQLDTTMRHILTRAAAEGVPPAELATRITSERLLLKAS